MQILDPRQIPQDKGPFFVFANTASDLVSFLISWRTNGAWNHTMMTVSQGKFATQGFGTYHEIPMNSYMKKTVRLEFCTLININPQAVTALQGYITNRIKSPWYHKMYDWLGIFGQAIGFPKIHTPGLEYCSEDVVKALKSICIYLPFVDCQIIKNIPDEINPQDLHDYFINNPKVFSIYGNYQGDEGVKA